VKIGTKLAIVCYLFNTAIRNVECKCGRHVIILDGFRKSWNMAHISPVVSKASILFRDRMKDKNDSKTRKKTYASTG